CAPISGFGFLALPSMSVAMEGRGIPLPTAWEARAVRRRSPAAGLRNQLAAFPVEWIRRLPAVSGVAPPWTPSFPITRLFLKMLVPLLPLKKTVRVKAGLAE